MVITFTVDGVGGEEEVSIPARYEVCDRCGGEGSHVNPSIDGNGITASEMDELGDDFRDDYLAGTYDVSCSECSGRRVVLVVDRDRAEASVLAQYDAWQEEEWAYERELRMERRYCGYDGF